MLEVIGFKEVSFIPDGEVNAIEGYTVYCTSSDDTKVTGVSCEHFFVSKQKAHNNNFKPEIGQLIDVYYNKYRKIDKINIA